MWFFHWIEEGQKKRQGFNFRICSWDSIFNFRLKITLIGILDIMLRRRNKEFYSKGASLKEYPRYYFQIAFQSWRVIKQSERFDRGDFSKKIDYPLHKLFHNKLWIQI